MTPWTKQDFDNCPYFGKRADDFYDRYAEMSKKISCILCKSDHETIGHPQPHICPIQLNMLLEDQKIEKYLEYGKLVFFGKSVLETGGHTSAKWMTADEIRAL